MTMLPGMSDDVQKIIAQSTGNVPATGGGNIEDILKGAGVTNPAAPNTNVLAQILGQLTKKTSAMPGANQPMTQKKYADIQDSTTGREFRAVGSNKRSAIGDIFHNVGSMITTAKQNKEAQDARTLAVDLERIMIAAQNPNDPKNQQIINDVLSDPKKRKAIEKALDISFMGEDKRDKVSKNAMDAALKKVQSMGQGGGTGAMSEQIPGVGGTPTNIGGGVPGQVPPQQQGGGTGVSLPQQRQMPQQQGQQQKPDYATQLMNKMPSMVTASPQTAVLEQLAKSGALEYLMPKQGEVIKSQTELMKQIFSDANKLKVAEIVANTKDKEMQTKLLQTMAQVNSKKYATDVLAAASKYKADKYADTILKKTTMIEERLKTTQAKGDKEIEAMIKQANSLTSQIKQAADEVKNTKPEGYIFKDKTKVDAAKERLQKLQKQFDQLQQTINMKRTTGGLSGGVNTGDRDSTEFNADEFLGTFKDYTAITGGDQEGTQ